MIGKKESTLKIVSSTEFVPPWLQLVGWLTHGAHDLGFFFRLCQYGKIGELYLFWFGESFSNDRYTIRMFNLTKSTKFDVEKYSFFRGGTSLGHWLGRRSTSVPRVRMHDVVPIHGELFPKDVQGSCHVKQSMPHLGILKKSITAGSTRAWTHTLDSSDSWHLLSWEKSNPFSASCKFNVISMNCFKFHGAFLRRTPCKKTGRRPRPLNWDFPTQLLRSWSPKDLHDLHLAPANLQKDSLWKEASQAPTSWSTPSLPVNNGCPKISSAKTSWSVGKKRQNWRKQRCYLDN